MLSACAKAVQTVGKACWNSVNVLPQSVWIAPTNALDHAENHKFLPVFSVYYTQRNPQSRSPIFNLLRPWLSTLSTQPITTTANLKTKKGNN